MALTARDVIDFFKLHQSNKVVLERGIYVTSQARIDIYCGKWQGKIDLNGVSRDVEFFGYGDGLYKAYIKL